MKMNKMMTTAVANLGLICGVAAAQTTPKETIIVRCQRIGLELSITPYEFAVSQLAIAHGLSLQRVSNPGIRHSLAADALAIFARGAQEN